MADDLLDNYNPLYDVHLQQYFASPHMQKHLRSIGLLRERNDADAEGENEVYARHNVMMDLLLKNREKQLAKLAALQKKLDAAEKVEICRKIRSGQTPGTTQPRARPSRSLSRGRKAASRSERRSSTSTDDRDLIRRIEGENEDTPKANATVYSRLSASVGKYRYLHKLDDHTLSAYMEELRKQLRRLERFRDVSFGPHSVARHPSEPQESWFFRRRSLPSFSDSGHANSVHEHLRSSSKPRSSRSPSKKRTEPIRVHKVKPVANEAKPSTSLEVIGVPAVSSERRKPRETVKVITKKPSKTKSNVNGAAKKTVSEEIMQESTPEKEPSVPLSNTFNKGDLNKLLEKEPTESLHKSEELDEKPVTEPPDDELELNDVTDTVDEAEEHEYFVKPQSAYVDEENYSSENEAESGTQAEEKTRAPSESKEDTQEVENFITKNTVERKTSEQEENVLEDELMPQVASAQNVSEQKIDQITEKMPSETEEETHEVEAAEEERSNSASYRREKRDIGYSENDGEYGRDRRLTENGEREESETEEASEDALQKEEYGQLQNEANMKPEDENVSEKRLFSDESLASVLIRSPEAEYMNKEENSVEEKAEEKYHMENEVLGLDQERMAFVIKQRDGYADDLESEFENAELGHEIGKVEEKSTKIADEINETEVQQDDLSISTSMEDLVAEKQEQNRELSSRREETPIQREQWQFTEALLPVETDQPATQMNAEGIIEILTGSLPDGRSHQNAQNLQGSQEIEISSPIGSNAFTKDEWSDILAEKRIDDPVKSEVSTEGNTPEIPEGSPMNGFETALSELLTFDHPLDGLDPTVARGDGDTVDEIVPTSKELVGEKIGCLSSEKTPQFNAPDEEEIERIMVNEEPLKSVSDLNLVYENSLVTFKPDDYNSQSAANSGIIKTSHWDNSITSNTQMPESLMLKAEAEDGNLKDDAAIMLEKSEAESPVMEMTAASVEEQDTTDASQDDNILLNAPPEQPTSDDKVSLEGKVTGEEHELEKTALTTNNKIPTADEKQNGDFSVQEKTVLKETRALHSNGSKEDTLSGKEAPNDTMDYESSEEPQVTLQAFQQEVAETEDTVGQAKERDLETLGADKEETEIGKEEVLNSSSEDRDRDLNAEICQEIDEQNLTLHREFQESPFAVTEDQALDVFSSEAKVPEDSRIKAEKNLPSDLAPSVSPTVKSIDESEVNSTEVEDEALNAYFDGQTVPEDNFVELELNIPCASICSVSTTVEEEGSEIKSIEVKGDTPHADSMKQIVPEDDFVEVEQTIASTAIRSVSPTVEKERSEVKSTEVEDEAPQADSREQIDPEGNFVELEQKIPSASICSVSPTVEEERSEVKSIEVEDEAPLADSREQIVPEDNFVELEQKIPSTGIRNISPTVEEERSKVKPIELEDEAPQADSREQIVPEDNFVELEQKIPSASICSVSPTVEEERSEIKSIEVEDEAPQADSRESIVPEDNFVELEQKIPSTAIRNISPTVEEERSEVKPIEVEDEAPQADSREQIVPEDNFVELEQKIPSGSICSVSPTVEEERSEIKSIELEDEAPQADSREQIVPEDNFVELEQKIPSASICSVSPTVEEERSEIKSIEVEDEAPQADSREQIVPEDNFVELEQKIPSASICSVSPTLKEKRSEIKIIEVKDEAPYVDSGEEITPEDNFVELEQNSPPAYVCSVSPTAEIVTAEDSAAKPAETEEGYVKGALSELAATGEGVMEKESLLEEAKALMSENIYTAEPEGIIPQNDTKEIDLSHDVPKGMKPSQLHQDERDVDDGLDSKMVAAETTLENDDNKDGMPTLQERDNFLENKLNLMENEDLDSAIKNNGEMLPTQDGKDADGSMEESAIEGNTHEEQSAVVGESKI